MGYLGYLLNWNSKLKTMQKTIFFVTTLFCCSYSAAADTHKIGVIDMNLVLQKAPLMISLNNNLTSKFKNRLEEINTTKKNLQDELDQLNLSTSNESARSNLQNKIINDKAQLAVLTANFDRDLTLAKNQALQTFTTKLTTVINQIAQSEQYDLIEQRANLAYVNSKLDITQKVMDELH